MHIDGHGSARAQIDWPKRRSPSDTATLPTRRDPARLVFQGVTKKLGEWEGFAEMVDQAREKSRTA